MPKSGKLSVSKRDKLPVSRGAGLNAKGRAKINRATCSSRLKGPVPDGSQDAKGRCSEKIVLRSDEQHARTNEG